jgi:hypothetical protein
MLGLAAVVPTVLYVILPVTASYLPFFSGRYSYYTDFFATFSGIGLWDAFFFMVFFGIAVHVSWPARVLEDGNKIEIMTLQSMIVVLCAFSLSSGYFSIIRDRASYEMWILYSILLAKGHLRLRWEARLAAFLVGAVFTFLNVLSYPGRLAFIPYENTIGCALSFCEGSGGHRQREMTDELDAALGR